MPEVWVVMGPGRQRSTKWFRTVAGQGELVAGQDEMSLENHGTQSTPGWKRYIRL